MTAVTAGPSPLSRLFDLSVEIERHSSDLQFSQKGTIHYVFDENIFELFAYPKRNRRFCQIFFGEGVHLPYASRTSSTTTVAQTALVAAEILFSGALPGQRSGAILLTRWHREELLDRMNEIILSAFRTSKGARRPDHSVIRSQLDFRELLQKRGKTDDQRVRPEESGRSDMFLNQDVEDLRREGGFDTSTLNLFRATRLEAARLSHDEGLEPLEQLGRILAREMQSKISGVTSHWRPPSTRELALEMRAKFWKRKLREEIQGQGWRRFTKSDVALENDAKSLSLLEWVALQLSGNERIVFVTADSTLINAYRRNYETRSSFTPGRHAPYLIRSALQYAPMFNAPVAVRENTKVDTLFKQIRETLNTSLASFQVAQLSGEREEAGVDDRLIADFQHETLQPPAVAATKDAEFSYRENRLDVFWRTSVEENGSLISQIQLVDGTWRRAERMTVGLASDLVAKRVSPDRIKLFEDLQGKSKPEQERLIVKYVEALIARLAISSLEVWKPIARKFFEKSVGALGTFESRVPLAIRLTVADNGVTHDLVDLLFAKDRQDRSVLRGSIVQFLENPFELFFAASVLALLKREWRLANHFSDMAVASFEFLQEAQSTSEVRATEAYYLSGLVLRIRLGATAVSGSRDGMETAERYYQLATSALVSADRCGREQQAAAAVTAFRQFRVSSERAALELFMLMQCHIAGKKWGEVARHYITARAELRHCAKVAGENSADLFRVTSRDESTALITRQFLVNVASLFVIGRLTDNENELDLSDPLIAIFDSTSSDLVATMGSRMTPLFAAELCAFDILRGKNIDENVSILRDLEQVGGRGLEIDSHLLRMIKSKFATE